MDGNDGDMFHPRADRADDTARDICAWTAGFCVRIFDVFQTYIFFIIYSRPIWRKKFTFYIFFSIERKIENNFGRVNIILQLYCFAADWKMIIIQNISERPESPPPHPEASYNFNFPFKKSNSFFYSSIFPKNLYIFAVPRSSDAETS